MPDTVAEVHDGTRASRAGLVACAIVLVGVFGLLLHRPVVPLDDQPRPDPQEYADSANRLAHGKGFSTTIDDFYGEHVGVNPPRYPPGYPIALAPFTWFGHYPENAQLGARVIALLLVVVVGVAAASIGGPWAAAVAMLLVGGTSFVRHSAILVFADAFGVLLTVLLVPMLRRSTARSVHAARWAVAAGLVAGIGVTVRLAGVVVLACLLLALPARRRLAALVASAPPIAALAVWQWVAFGRPWRTGYGYWLPGIKVLGLELIAKAPLQGDANLFPDTAHGHLTSWICSAVHCGGTQGAINSLPNWAFYPLTLLGAFWVVTPPLVAAFGFWWAARSWNTDPAARFACLLPIALAAFYLAYFFQGARFMAPATFPLLAFASAGVVVLGRRAIARARGTSAQASA